ncbi:MAG: hypothetical protein WC980_06835, partial [Candidatus Brocadiia bacterium]
NIMNNYLSNVSHNTASFYGNLNPNGLATAVYFEYGATTAYGTTTTSQSAGSGTTSTSASADITGLTASTTYHFRMVATNSAGTSYGTDQTFNTSTQPIPPTATTGSATNITYNSVTLTGTANPNGFAATAYFQWGTTTAYGSTTQTQDIGSGTGNINVAIYMENIFANTTYHFRMVTANDSGTALGNDQTFVTPAGPPTGMTNPATDIDFSSATLNGLINPNGLSTTAWFEWGPVTPYANTTTIRSAGSSTAYANFTENITGLTTNATYHYRLVANNASGAAYGSDQVFTAVTNTRWTHIAGGEFHTMGVKNDGTLWAWGDNSYGQLGLGNYVTQTAPTQVGTETNWKKTAVGAEFSVALKTDGTIWSCGDNAEGQLGLGILVTGTNSFTRIGTDSNWADIAAGGHSHTGGTTTTGDVLLWGDNLCGQLGLGDDVFRYDPTRVFTDSSVASIACGNDSTLIIKKDGSLNACGDNSQGELGLGDNANRSTFTKVGTDTNWAEVESGYRSTVARKTDGSLYGCGDNNDGELGLGDYNDRNSMTRIGSDNDWTDVSVGYKHAIGKKTGGSIWEWGDNSEGQLGLGDLVTRTAPTQVMTDTDWSIIEAGWKHSIGIKNDDSMLGWGDNAGGQLGNNSTNDSNTPSSALCWVEIKVGYDHTLGRKSNGTIWSWGRNQYGQLGLGDYNYRLTPVQIGNATDWVGIGIGENHSVARKKNGTIWAWGFNGSGQLGLGDTTARIYPTRIGTDTNWIKIIAGGNKTFSIKSNGTLWGCGSNTVGELGLGNTALTYVLTQVGADTNWLEVTCKNMHTIARKNNGTIWAWGANSSGQLGRGTIDSYPNTSWYTPSQIGTDSDWAEISNDLGTSLARKTNGSIWYWGSASLSYSLIKTTPTLLGTDNDWAEIACTEFSRQIARKSNGTLCSIEVTTGIASQIDDDSEWTEFSTSIGTTGVAIIARKNNGTIWSWGQNAYGRLGLGDFSPRDYPTQVGQ